MEVLNNLLESKTISMKYSNYRFYFVDNVIGVKEVKKISIYDNKKILLEMNKPWFNNVNSVDFGVEIECKDNVLFDGSVFYVEEKNKKHVHLYIPNEFAQFEKVGEEDSDGFYKKVSVYKSNNESLNYHIEKINTIENDIFLKKIKATCLNSKNKDNIWKVVK